MEKFVYWFKELNKDSVKIAGGKGANLGEMFNAGFPIPNGFVVATNAYFYFIEKTGIKEKIREILEKINYDDFESLKKASEEIKKIILSQEIPHEIKSQIVEYYLILSKQYNKDYEFVAVRSSATAEDIKEASFAGQQETYLNVYGEKELIESVKKCWASLFTPRAIFYRHNAGFDHLKVGIAVVVQKMVQSEISGVMFTKHPITGEEIAIVEAVYGLGEGIVSGRYTPDHYEVDERNMKIVKKIISEQDKYLTYDPVLRKNVEKEVPLELRKKQKLSDSKIIELVKIGLDIENHYNYPQDIEWAIEEGRVFIVQSRPITTIKKDYKKTEINVKLEPILKGLPASPGIASGKVKIVKTLDDLEKIEKGDVLVTKMTNPDMVPAMKKASAIITDEGGVNCHAAIVSRELGIPAVVGTREATKVLKENEVVTVDGYRGVVYRGDVTKQIQEEKEEIKEVKTYIPTATKIMVNLSNPDLAEKIAKKDVDGVGLLRAEFMVVNYIGYHPMYAIENGKEEEFVDKLAEGISKVARAFYPRVVIYRSFDFKTNEYKNLKGGEKYEPEERNPMIGFRGAFRSIKQRKVFELELKALRKVREEYNLKNVWLMIPFVRTVEEIKEIRKIIEEWGFFKDRDFKLLIMAEVPSVVLLAKEFLKYADGYSIGSNDLTQLILGVDRDNELLAEIYDERNEAVLKALKILIRTAKKMKKYVSICGQAPSNYPELVEFLVRNGIDAISVNPDVIEETRKLVASIEKKIILEKLREL